MKKVAVCISGQFRSFDDCYKSIIETFITSNPNVITKVFISFSKEKDKYIFIPSELYSYCGKIKIEEDSLLPDLSYQLENFKSSDFQLNQKAGTISSYYQLLQIKNSYNLMLEYEKEHDIEFDYVFRIRPDLRYESEFEWEMMDDSITILKGNDWNGYNDKFAFGPKSLMLKYMTRFDFWMSQNNKNESTHNETNLKLWLDENKIKINRTNLRYNYVRYNDKLNPKIEIIEITEDKISYRNITNEDIDVLIKIYDRNESLFGEIANYVYYSKEMKLPPRISFYTACPSKAPNKKMASIEGKDLYIEYQMI